MRLIALLLAVLTAGVTNAATLLPNGKQQFIDGNGRPLARGQVYFYVPGTTTPKNTYQDSDQNVLNTNPVILDGNGYAIIYGSGAYRQILQNSAGITLWDTLTADTSANGPQWAGTSTGSANTQDVSDSAFTAADGQSISFIAGFTNTGPATLVVNGSNYSVYKDTATGPTTLTGNEIVTATISTVVYDQTLGGFHLVTVPQVAAVNNSPVTLASGTVVNLGAAGSQVVTITGNTTISSFGSSASTSNPFYYITFQNGGALGPLVQNSASLITPAGQGILPATGDAIVAQYLGSGNWQVVNYQRIADNGMAPGHIIAFASAICPAGYLEANGAAISRNTYVGLFSTISTVWGSGDGSTTFNLPDFRGQFLRGWADGSGTDPGRTFASSQTDQAGTVTYAFPASTGGAGTPTGVVIGVQNAGTVTFNLSTGETRPKNYAVQYCVKF